jgi:hypothetical protein
MWIVPILGSKHVEQADQEREKERKPSGSELDWIDLSCKGTERDGW